MRSEWLVPLPETLDPLHAMALGTAGLTAMLCVMALEEHGLRPVGREVVVTGASGGVGSVAVSLLARLGYHVAAATGSPDAHSYLESLGARRLVSREEVAASAGKPLDSERWGGAVDTVGGPMLAGVLAAAARGSSVAACGNAGGGELPTTVFPFILRGVNLLGIESVYCPAERRSRAWQRLSAEMDRELLGRVLQVAPLDEVPKLSEAILDGAVRGRVVVDVGD